MTCHACGHFVDDGQPCRECAGYAADCKEGRPLCGDCRDVLPDGQADGTLCEVCA